MDGDTSTRRGERDVERNLRARGEAHECDVSLTQVGEQVDQVLVV